MPIISSPGIGSGVDIAGIVNKLSDLERQPLVQLKKQVGTLESRLSVYGQVKSQMASLQDAAAKLSSNDAWSQFKVTSSNSAAVTATAGSSAMPVKLDLEVLKLAKGQVSSFATVAMDQTLSDGTLEIQQGSWASGVFSSNGGGPTVISIKGGQKTVSTFAAKINSSGGSVQAYVVQDVSGERLVLRSRNTGKDQGFNVSFKPSDAAPDPGFEPAAAALRFMSPFGEQFAQDAQFKVDGIELTSASNTITQALPGMSFSLQQVSSTPVKISVENDQESMKKNIQALIDSFNALNSTLGNAVKYNTDKKSSAPLQGDSTAVGVQSALRSLFRSEMPGFTFQRLSDVGISIQRDGSLGVDSKKFESALANPSAVKALFTASTGFESMGFAKKVETFIKHALDTDGRVAARADALQSAIKRNLQDQERVNDRADRAQARLIKVYNSMDSKVGSLNALNSYVSQQLASMTK
ncbi:flagellar filament capping protein FliD [Limnohabitans sp. DM1]|uniref:flagellar filament capping protein FliD n=1 Tax=Limnohabitans sp. DM1 TaxID=1597955 RepID=UPI000B26B959|nr:flagellar filament capping protein FliD [Limnohabitans sp. DM1]